MKLIDFAATPIEEIPLLLKELSPMQIRASAEQMNEAQIAPAVKALTETNDAEWKEKLIELILGLTTRSKIESVGKALSLEQAAYILPHPYLNKTTTKEELSALLVGLHHHHFLQLLLLDQNAVLTVLKQEVNTEAVQHHLTVLTHEMVNRMNECESRSIFLVEGIENLKVNELSPDDILSTTHRIDDLSEALSETMSQLSKLLQLAWNTQRADLVEKLSSAKEAATRYRHHIIGIPRSFKKNPTGLYLALENKLFSVYGNSENPADIEAIKDDEPAIEALVKLSLWYVQDYWEVGLLPHIKTTQELTSLPKELRDRLILVVNQNLTKLGLATAADLKAARIFSRKSLQEHISKYSHKM